MQPDSRHVVLFLAAPNIFLPVRKLGIYRSEGHEDALTEGATVLHEPGIYAGDVLMENPIETPCPSLPDVLLPQPGNQLGRLVRYQTDRKSTRLNSSHGYISYAVFCLKKKTTNKHHLPPVTATRTVMRPC